MRKIWVLVVAAVLGLSAGAVAGLELSRYVDPLTGEVTYGIFVPGDGVLVPGIVYEIVVISPGACLYSINLSPDGVLLEPPAEFIDSGSWFWGEPPVLPGVDEVIFVFEPEWEDWWGWDLPDDDDYVVVPGNDNPVPEPGAAMLLGVGAVGLWRRRRGQ